MFVVEKRLKKSIALWGIWYNNGLFSPEQTPPAMNFLLPALESASQGGDRILGIVSRKPIQVHLSLELLVCTEAPRGRTHAPKQMTIR